MKRETEMYVFHDELFYKLIVPYTDKKETKGSKVELVGGDKSFSTHEISMLLILLDHYIKNKGLSIPITLKKIHKCYRNKRTGKKDIMSYSNKAAYSNALRRLQEKKINVEINNKRKRYKVNNKNIYGQRLLKITDWKSLSDGDFQFEYSFGDYGNILLKSKRYSNNVPIEMIHASYQQITFVYIMLYLSRLIFINRRKLIPNINITIDGLMKRIIQHDKNGNSTRKSLSDVLEQDVKNKYIYLKIFKKHLKMVLRLFEDNGIISSYKFNIIKDLDELNIKNYKNCKLKIVINK